MESVALCPPSSTDTNNSKGKKSLISEWVVRFALNAEKALDAKEQAVYRSMWEDGFSDVEASQLQAAFVACLRSHTYKTMPTIGDVRQHLQKAEASAVEEEAASKWTRVLAYAVRLSPDVPEKKPPRISEQVRRAINAAGGLNFIRECDSESLVWARKRFVEAYLRYAELERDGNLFPEGLLTNLLAGGANKKLLPADAHETARAIGLAEVEKPKELRVSEPDIHRAVAAIQTVTEGSKPRPPMRSLDEQKKILREKGWLR